MVKVKFQERSIHMKKQAITVLSILAILVSSFILWGAQEAIAQEYTLTVERRGEGRGAVSDHRRNTYGEGVGSVFNQGTKITLKAEADQDSFFEGWEGGGCSGAKMCTVTMDSDISVTAVFGTADKVPQISVSSAVLDFGKVKVKKTGTQTLIIGNTGTGNLKGSVSLPGGGGAFAISGTKNFNLKPNKNKAVKVVFKPSTLGIQTAEVEVTSNDPNNDFEVVFLQGEGVCDNDHVYLLSFILKISIDIRPLSPLNPKFVGEADIPLTIHECKGSKNRIQVTGKGGIDLTYHAEGGGCTQDGTLSLLGIILPSGLGLGTNENVFIKLNLLAGPGLLAEQCCEDDPCESIDIPFPALLKPIETEIALTDGAVAKIPCSVPDLACLVYFTMVEIQAP
jgi:hypothetical protein